MKAVQFVLQIFSRVLIGSYFIVTALVKIFNWHEGEKALFEALSQWELHLPDRDWASVVLTELFQAPTILIGVSFGSCLVLGALFVLGIRKRLALTGLIVCAFTTAVLYHPFWFFEGRQFDEELRLFMLQHAVIGGLLVHALSPGKERGYASQGKITTKLRNEHSG